MISSIPVSTANASAYRLSMSFLSSSPSSPNLSTNATSSISKDTDPGLLTSLAEMLNNDKNKNEIINNNNETSFHNIPTIELNNNSGNNISINSNESNDLHGFTLSPSPSANDVAIGDGERTVMRTPRRRSATVSTSCCLIPCLLPSTRPDVSEAHTHRKALIRTMKQRQHQRRQQNDKNNKNNVIML